MSPFVGWQQEAPGSGGGFEDEGFRQVVVLRAGIDDFSFDVGAVEQADVDGAPLG